MTGERDEPQEELILGGELLAVDDDCASAGEETL